MGEFADIPQAAVSKDDNPNIAVSLPEVWAITTETPDNQISLSVSKRDANSFRNAYGHPGILDWVFYPFPTSVLLVNIGIVSSMRRAIIKDTDVSTALQVALERPFFFLLGRGGGGLFAIPA